jgi:hypothetical protein
MKIKDQDNKRKKFNGITYTKDKVSSVRKKNNLRNYVKSKRKWGSNQE